MSKHLDLIHPQDEPEVLKMCNTVLHISQEKVLTMLAEELRAEQFHNEKRSFHALRAGALFHVLKQQMGGGYSGFWKLCEDNFGVSKMTVSRKMRLFAAFAKKSGASEEQVLELAQAADFDKDAPLGQLVMSFIGDDDVSELYRKHKITEPKEKGGYRPNNDDVQTWLKEFHPALEGAKYDALPKNIQKEFREYLPPVDPATEQEILDGRWNEIERLLAPELEEKTHVGLKQQRRKELRALFYDAFKAFDDVLNKEKKS